jgi:competence protein ComEC
MLSIILGNSNLLEEEELVLYRNLGLAHILAVSGLHIGIISGFLIFIFSRLGIKRKFNYIITLSIIWLYATLIGYSPSTLRACLMISILFLANLSHEP